MTKPTMRAFNEIVEKICKSLLLKIEAELITPKVVHAWENGKEVKAKDRRWKVAYAERRQMGEKIEDRVGVQKFTIVLQSGAILCPVLPDEFRDWATELWAMRGKLFKKKWHGLGITLYPDGKWELTYNYDRESLGDPHFFDADDKPPPGEKAEI